MHFEIAGSEERKVYEIGFGVEGRCRSVNVMGAFLARSRPGLVLEGADVEASTEWYEIHQAVREVVKSGAQRVHQVHQH